MLTIGGWDATPSSCGPEYIPVFYFIPDYELISFLHMNGHRHVPVHIEGTDKYDGDYWITTDKQPDTVWHVGFLSEISFTGRPMSNGSMSLSLPRDYVAQPLTCVLNGCC